MSTSVGWNPRGLRFPRPWRRAIGYPGIWGSSMLERWLDCKFKIEIWRSCVRKTSKHEKHGKCALGLTPESEKYPQKFLLFMLRRTWSLRVELHYSKGGPIKLSLVVPLARHRLLCCTPGTGTLWRTETEWRDWWYITNSHCVYVFLCFGVISQQKLATPFPGGWDGAAESLFNHDLVLGCRRPDEEFVAGPSGYRDLCQFPHATVFPELFCLTYAALSRTVPKWSLGTRETKLLHRNTKLKRTGWAAS